MPTTTTPKVATPRPSRATRRVRVVPSILPAPKPAPKPAPAPPTKARPKTPQTPPSEPAALRNVWVKGQPVGINHQYGARKRPSQADAALAALTGQKQAPLRYKTKAAKAWEQQVIDTVGYAALARRLLGPTAWNVDDTRRGAPVIEVTLRFVYQPATNLTRPDADAAQKLTLDALTKGLGLDDRVVKRVTSSITLAPTPETPTGCLISIERLTPDVVAEADRALLATIAQLDRTGALSSR